MKLYLRIVNEWSHQSDWHKKAFNSSAVRPLEKIFATIEQLNKNTYCQSISEDWTIKLQKVCWEEENGKNHNCPNPNGWKLCEQITTAQK
jgi:hypothetical protein